MSRTKQEIPKGEKAYRRSLGVSQIKTAKSRRLRRKVVAKLRREMRGKPTERYNPPKTYAMDGTCANSKHKEDLVTVKKYGKDVVVRVPKCMACAHNPPTPFVEPNGTVSAFTGYFSPRKFWERVPCFRKVKG